MEFNDKIPAFALCFGITIGSICAFGAESSQARVVNFPQDRSLGVLYLRDAGVEGRESWQDWEELSQARGEISVLPGQELRLMVSGNNYEHLADLASLGANDIQDLHIRCRNLRDSDLMHLNGLTGLQSLALSSGRSSYTCPLTGEGFVNLKRMRSLRNLVIQFTMISDESLAHFRYLTSLESLTLWNDEGISGDGLSYLKDLPALRAISFYVVPIEDFGLEKLKGMSQLEYLSLQYTHVTDEGLAHLKGLTGLRELVLPPATTDMGLANLKGLTSLEELAISDAKVTGDGLVHLKGLPQLKSLSISGREMNGRGLIHLHGLSRLEKLKISMWRMDDEGMKGLQGLTSVTSLYLGDTKVSDLGLANVDGLARLEFLNLKNTLITDASLTNLKRLTALRTLVLEGTQITDAGLANLQGLAALRSLWLQGTDITDAGLTHLRGLQALDTLYLDDTPLSDTGLINLKELHSLQYLNLNGTNVSGAGFAYLQDLKSLRHLYVCVGKLSGAGLRHLRQMTWLHELGLGKGSLSEQALADLKKALPDCSISVRPVRSRPPKPKPVPPSLLGRPLPQLKDLKIDLSPAQSAHKMMLICFFDMEQRPSRNCVIQLTKRAKKLKQGGVFIAAVQASELDENRLGSWAKENDLPFPVGIVQADGQKTRFTWGIKSLPWLILTDAQHIVRAQGFGIEALETKLADAVIKPSSVPVRQEAPPERTVRGMVVDPNGQALAQIPITTYLCQDREATTGEDGRFAFKLPPNYRYERDFLIVARDRKQNLAAFCGYLGQDTIVMKLEPAVTVAGTISDEQGNGLANAQLVLFWRIPSASASFGQKEAVTFDQQGRFEIKAIPYGRQYSVDVSAQGYGSARARFDTRARAAGIQLPPLVLHTADQSVRGMVVDPNGTPVVDAKVSAYGEGQPSCQVRSDKQGRFLMRGVCPGAVELYGVHTQGPIVISGDMQVQAGDMKVNLVLDKRRRRETQNTPKFESLLGKSLPELVDLGIVKGQIDTANKQILVCFFDMQQRPARRRVMQLARQAQQLQQKGVAVVVVQTSKVDEARLHEWAKKYDVPFPMSVARGFAEKLRYLWGVKSLPWLILTDKTHKVLAEGFGLSKLDQLLGRSDSGTVGQSDRVVHFPSDRNLGRVSVGVLRPLDPHWWLGWQDMGLAQGTIRVPADQSLQLTVNGTTVQNLEAVRSLAPGDIQVISFSGIDVNDAHLSQLVGLQGLEMLVSYSSAVGDQGLESISKLDSLVSLIASQGSFTVNGLKCLQDLKKLQRLDLTRAQLTNDALSALRGASSLKVISLAAVEQVTGDGLLHLAQLPNLEKLTLDSLTLSDNSFSYFQPDSLRYLRLNFSTITDAGLVHVGKLKSLESLSLFSTGISDGGILHLKHLNKLRELNLTNTRVSDESAEALAQLTRLEKLELTRWNTDALFRELRALQGLKHLNISRIQLGDEGLEALGSFTALESLQLPKGVEDFAFLGHLPRLQELLIQGTRLGPDMADHLTGLQSLKKLLLHEFEVPDNDYTWLNRLSSLEELTLWAYGKEQTGSLGDSILAAASSLKHIKKLDLRGVKATELGLQSCQDLTAVEELTLVVPEITHTGISSLASAISLKRLLLSGDTLDPHALKPMAKLKALREMQLSVPEGNTETLLPLTDIKPLRSLRLSGFAFDANSIPHLQALAKTLDRLTVYGRGMSEEQKQEIEQQVPNCRVVVPRTLSSRTSAPPKPKRYPSLVGKKTPDFHSLGIESLPVESASPVILGCFVDIMQRPSRHLLVQLGQRAQQLQRQGISVMAVQASPIEQKTLAEWRQNNKLPFTIQRLDRDIEKTRHTWGVKSLPWLILTDKDHVVRAEGFSMGELELLIEQQ